MINNVNHDISGINLPVIKYIIQVFVNLYAFINNFIHNNNQLIDFTSNGMTFNIVVNCIDNFSVSNRG